SSGTLSLNPPALPTPLTPFASPALRSSSLKLLTSHPPHLPLPLSPLQSLLEAHDSVASKNYDTPPPSPESMMDTALNNQPVPPDGVTFRVEGGELVIARILHGGMIDQQGLLHVGDIIKEVNGKEVCNDPKVLQEMLQNASGSVILKILPSYQEPHVSCEVFVKCHFEYDPNTDNLIPCKEAGLKFACGDILQIVNQEDLNWWQVSPTTHVAGLIPSQLLEEKRKAFSRIRAEDQCVSTCVQSSEFDRHELLIYEEMAKMPPFQRKTLVLIGAQGVGRRSLKNRLILSEPKRFGTTIPFTSRKPKDDEKDGQVYTFVSRNEMENDIKGGRYLEHGEYEGNLYGTKIDSIHRVVESGKICILDVNPQALKVLRTSEFMPYVVFIEKTVDESCRIHRCYNHYFDYVIGNDNLDKAFHKLQSTMEKLCIDPQWVPVSWVY
uniref:MAGUK p55 scaffold protein 2b n=1 Tax=Callorhinchus milii TaxID=7868 RepID=A0A4W3I265_CALMI